MSGFDLDESCQGVSRCRWLDEFLTKDAKWSTIGLKLLAVSELANLFRD